MELNLYELNEFKRIFQFWRLRDLIVCMFVKILQPFPSYL